MPRANKFAIQNQCGNFEVPCSIVRLISRSLRAACIAIATIVLCAVFTVELLGQATEYGQINGTVTDQNGNVLVNARVIARNVATNIEQTAQTNSAGQYRIFNLLPGQYTLRIEATGFKAATIELFTLNVGQTVTQNRSLVVGSTTETVNVTAEGQLLDATTVGSTTVIQEKAIVDLPLNGRNYTQLIGLTPGANGTRINGQWSDGNRFVLDGNNNTTILGASSAYVPNLDSIQEFSISSHSSNAEFGGFLGATVSVATKSGTNKLSGELWEFVRTNEFQARNPITQLTLKELPPYHQHQYGFVVGGPLTVPKLYKGKDRTFFFFSFQRFQVHQQNVVLSRVPTTAELNGDFSQSIIGRNIFDPNTTTTGAGGTQMRQQFPNNVIPTNRIDPLTQGYLKTLLPTPNYSSPTNVNVNRFDIFPNNHSNNDYSVRIDHRLGTKDNLWVRYSQLNDESLSSTNALINQLNSQGRKNLAADWVHLFSPTLFIESNYTYASFPGNVIHNTFPGGAAQFTDALVKLGFSQSHISKYGIPDFLNVGNFSTPYIIGNYATWTSSPVSITEALSWVTGRHSTKFGFNLSRKDFTNMAQGDHYFFNVGQTADPQNVGSTGIELASLLLGLPQSYSIGTGNYTEAFNNWSVYGEDEWKMRHDLVLSIGLRYDSFPTPNFLNGSIINDWDYKTGEYLIGGSKLPPPCNVSNAAPCIPGTGNLGDLPNGNMIKLAKYPGIRYPIHDNFGPRVGVAWNAFRNTVFHLGYGIYFDTESSTAQEAQNTFGTWPTNQSLSGSVNAVGATQTTVAQISQTSQAPVTTGVPWGQNTYYWDPRKKDAMSQQWNFDIQHQFAKDFSLTTGYVGSIGRRLDLNIAANTSPAPGPGTPAQVNARRPFPFYGSDTLYGTDLGRNNYNALQVKAEKRFAGGYSFLGSYTWSKTIDNGTDGWYIGNPQNAYDLHAERGPSNSDRTHILSLSAIYELPFGRGKRWLQSGPLSYVVGNWQFNAIGIAESGAPVRLFIPGDVANIGNAVKSYERPNLVGDPHLSNPSSAAWFNTAAFAVPALSFGTAGRGIIRNHGYQNADLSLFKNFPFRETMNLQLRLEAFNAFNLQIPGSADGNASTGNKTFGRITSISSTPRILQFGAKFYF